MSDPRSYVYVHTATKINFIIIFTDGTSPVTISAYTFEEAKELAIQRYPHQDWTLREIS